jgi:hypothetical protein
MKPKFSEADIEAAIHFTLSEIEKRCAGDRRIIEEGNMTIIQGLIGNRMHGSVPRALWEGHFINENSRR